MSFTTIILNGTGTGLPFIDWSVDDLQRILRGQGEPSLLKSLHTATAILDSAVL